MCGASCGSRLGVFQHTMVGLLLGAAIVVATA
jgi:hypothetical protein